MSQDEHRNNEEEGIKVKDKRRFTPEGETREPDEDTGEKELHASHAEAPKEHRQEPAASTTEGTEQKSAGAPPGGQDRRMPPMDFATFLLSLASSVQIHLGVIANPQTGKQETNLQLAKETIDLLELLREKTKGNLTDDEEKIFEHVLYELRMLYVEKSKQTT